MASYTVAACKLCTCPNARKQLSCNVEMRFESLKYVASYIASKYRKQYPDLGDITAKCGVNNQEHPSWIFALSMGGLTDPSDYMFKQI